MLLSGPGVLAGQSVADLVSLNDVFPTVLAMAAVPLPRGLAGRSLLPLIDGESAIISRVFPVTSWHGLFRCQYAARC